MLSQSEASVATIRTNIATTPTRTETKRLDVKESRKDNNNDKESDNYNNNNVQCCDNYDKNGMTMNDDGLNNPQRRRRKQQHQQQQQQSKEEKEVVASTIPVLVNVSSILIDLTNDDDDRTVNNDVNNNSTCCYSHLEMKIKHQQPVETICLCDEDDDDENDVTYISKSCKVGTEEFDETINVPSTSSRMMTFDHNCQQRQQQKQDIERSNKRFKQYSSPSRSYTSETVNNGFRTSPNVNHNYASSTNYCDAATTKKCTNTMVVYIATSDDDFVVTDGIGILINTLLQNQNEYQHQQVVDAKPKPKPKRTIWTCHSTTIQHIQQCEKWSCGYRNTQMMLSALVPILPQNHSSYYSTYQYNNNNNNMKHYNQYSFEVPSVRQIQISIEQSWLIGYDPKGAQHYRNKLVGTSSFIGAVEVATYLSYEGIDCCVVQFMKCSESRKQIGLFCYHYFFHTNTRNNNNNKKSSVGIFNPQQLHDTNENHTSLSIATTALQLCNDASSSPATTSQQQQIVSKLLPLYLQWQGHSVTIVGVELRTDGTVKYLLVFDPVQNGSDLYNHIHTMDNLTILRLPCRKVETKDCQLVVCSTQSKIMTEQELQQQNPSTCTKTIPVLTAAEHAVRKATSRFC